MANEEDQIKPDEADYRFLTLVMSLATAAWAQLGKVPHPNTKKIEKDLDQAQLTIEFLRMLKEKTQGNLRPKESELLSNILADLELNYADEVGKEKKEQGQPASQGPEIILPHGASKGPEIIKP